MSTQIERFAFVADHETDYHPKRRHGHTWHVMVETAWRGDHKVFRETVAQAAIRRLHMSFLDEVPGLDQGEGGTGEAVLDWIWAQLEQTEVKPVAIEVTELSAEGDTFAPVGHVKRRVVGSQP